MAGAPGKGKKDVGATTLTGAGTPFRKIHFFYKMMFENVLPQRYIS